MNAWRAVEPEVQQRLDHSTRQALPPIATGLAILIAWAAWSERALIGQPRAPVFWADVVVSTIFAAIAIWSWSRPIPSRFVQPTTWVIAAAAATTALVSDAYSTGSPDTVDLVVVLLGAGLVLLSVPLFAALVAYVWAGWSLVQNDWIPRFSDSGEFILMIATLIASAAFGARYRTMVRMIHAEATAATGRAKAEALAEELGRFASVVAHDLQNPVSGIRLKAALIKRGLPEGSKESGLAKDVDRIAQSMGTMIKDLLDYAKAGRSPGASQPIAWRPFFQEIEAIFHERLQLHGGGLDVAELPEVRADVTQMRQLFLNLIGNSIHYRRPEQPINITVHGFHLQDGVVLTVTDDGQGFEEELAAQIFMPFERGTSDRPGHGLGLATCRRIVENLGGTINAASQPGGGSVFTLWFPDEGPENGDAATPADPPDDGHADGAKRPPRPKARQAAPTTSANPPEQH